VKSRFLAFATTGLAALSLNFFAPRVCAADEDSDLPQQIFDTMIKVHGVKEGSRPVHAKGVVCHGTFTPTKEAADLSKAAHFNTKSVPVVVRFSDGSPDPMIPDGSPNAGPRGFAIRFALPGGEDTDIVAMSHNGFVVGSGQEFLALQKSIVATDPSKPHPWPVEEFLGAHPRALKFVQENQIAPASFANESFFSNNAFTFVNKDGVKQVGRYKFIPMDGEKKLSADEAKQKPENFLSEDLKKRLPDNPVKYRMIVQLPNGDDATNDPSVVWPEDRKTIELGTVTITSVDPHSDQMEKSLAFDPATLTDGIDFSDDSFPELRSKVYALSVARRQK
jgi:catalase